MEHFFNLVGILIFSCAVQFFYFKSLTNNVVISEESSNSEPTEEELSPENFKNFNYYIEKFSN